MKNRLTFIFLFFIVLTSFAQKNVDRKTMIGFGCYSSGEKSETVNKFSKILTKKKYKSFAGFLDSENNAEKVLAAFVCEKLNKLGEINLSANELEKIKLIHNSEELVSICSGCMYFDKLPIKKLFSENEETLLTSYGSFWFDNYMRH